MLISQGKEGERERFTKYIYFVSCDNCRGTLYKTRQTNDYYELLLPPSFAVGLIWFLGLLWFCMNFEDNQIIQEGHSQKQNKKQICKQINTCIKIGIIVYFYATNILEKWIELRKLE